MKGNKVKLFLDSGAHSLYKKEALGEHLHDLDFDFFDGKVFDEYVDEYAKFIKKYEKHFHCYVNVDVIRDAERTWEVQKYLEKRWKLNPIPVFHFGEDLKYLERYVENYDYIGVGGLGQGITSKLFTEKMGDPCFDIICDTPDRTPRVKVHGFALTSLKMMFAYPWYSVDSTSWVMTSRYGSVYVPFIRDGDRLEYNEDNWKLCVSARSPETSVHDKHFDNLGKEGPFPEDVDSDYQEKLLRYFRSKGYEMGKSEFREEGKGYELKEDEMWSVRPTVKKFKKKGEIIKENVPGVVEKVIESGLCNDYIQRDKMNIIYFYDLQKSMPPYPQPFKKKQTMSKVWEEKKEKKSANKQIQHDKNLRMHIYLATWLEDNQGRTLSHIGYENRLISYFFIRENPSFDLVGYVRDGLIGYKKEKK